MRRYMLSFGVAWALVGFSLLAGEGSVSKSEEKLQSGLELGKILPAFNPIHVTGPDKGTNTCPV